MSQAGVSSGWSVVDASAENGGVVQVQVVTSSFLPLALTVSDRHKAQLELNEARQVTRTSHASTRSSAMSPICYYIRQTGGKE